ncbi:hypothetical protein ACL58G_29435 [Massilia sp. GER05]|uniref:hypothetical protein n=1 Tax=Massilia sp. GER05 TaxID=3394605 RepID=UPI003F87A86E
MDNFALALAVFLVFNVPVVVLLMTVPFARLMRQALQEKAATGDGTGATSYSRVTGALGAVMLTTFFWAIGNLVLADAVLPGRADRIAPLLGSVDHFFLVGSALFLPYAFNQLKTLFPWGARATAALADAQARAPIYLAPPAAIAPLQVTIANLGGIDDATLQRTVAAIQLQVDQHLVPEWRCPGILTARRMAHSDVAASVAGTTDAVIYLANQANDPLTGLEPIVGIHRDAGQDKPYGFVYLDKCAEYKEDWSVTLSHEVLELLVDPTAVLTVDDQSGVVARGTKVALEVCDPVQGTPYKIGDICVANFVNRAFFGMLGQSKDMNYRGIPQKPYMPLPDGYVQDTDTTGYSWPRWGAEDSDAQQAARAALGPYRRNARRAARAAPPLKAGAIGIVRRGQPRGEQE